MTLNNGIDYCVFSNASHPTKHYTNKPFALPLTSYLLVCLLVFYLFLPVFLTYWKIALFLN